MIAIKDKTPVLLNLTGLLDAYISHQKEVVTRQSRFDLRKAQERSHIVEGLIKAISILDELIATIRGSKDKQDAKRQIQAAYGFTDPQAEAIVNLQLYRLTNTDITSLQQEADELQKKINYLEGILGNEQKLLSVIKNDLKQIKKKYTTPRMTKIENQIEELKINLEVMVASEDVLVSVTRDGYLKRTSLRSYAASNGGDFAMKEEDHLVGLLEVNTTDTVLLFTNRGRYVFAPVHTLPDIRWKDLGQHVSNVVSLDKGETITRIFPIRTFDEDHYLIFFTKNGMIKRSELKLYEAQRYSKALVAVNLKGDDEVVNVEMTTGDSEVFIATNRGYGLWYHESEVTPVGQRAAGVKAIQLKPEEYVVNGIIFNQLDLAVNLLILTQRGAAKRMTLQDFEISSRAKRGQIMLRELKKKPHRIVGFVKVEPEDAVSFMTNSGSQHQLNPLELSKSDRYSNGSFVIDTDIDGEVVDVWKQANYRKVFEDNESSKLL